MSKHTSEDRIQADCTALNKFAGREIEYVGDLAEFAAERGMQPSEVWAAALRMDDEEVERQAEAETTEQVGCLVIPNGPEKKNVRLTTFDIFHGGVKANEARVIIKDTDGHEAWLDLAPDALVQAGEWLVREGQRLQAGEAP